MLDPTNEPFSLAEIAGNHALENDNRQYVTGYRSIMMVNLSGAGENLHIEDSQPPYTDLSFPEGHPRVRAMK